MFKSIATKEKGNVLFNPPDIGISLHCLLKQADAPSLTEGSLQQNVAAIHLGEQSVELTNVDGPSGTGCIIAYM